MESLQSVLATREREGTGRDLLICMLEWLES